MYISGNTNITEHFTSQNIKQTYYNLYFKMSVSSIKRAPEEKYKKLPDKIVKFVSKVKYLLSRDTDIDLSIVSKLEISPEQNEQWYIRTNTFYTKNNNLYHGKIFRNYANNNIILSIKMLGLCIIFDYSGKIFLEYYDKIMWPDKETINITVLSYYSIVEHISQAYKTQNNLSRQTPSVWTRQDHTSRPSVLSYHDREPLQDSVGNCLRTGVDPCDTCSSPPKRVKMSSCIDNIDKTDIQQSILRNKLLESSLISKQHTQDARSIIETQPRPPPSLCDSSIATLYEITPDVNVMHLDKLPTLPTLPNLPKLPKDNQHNIWFTLMNCVLKKHISITNTMSQQQHMDFTQHMTSIFNTVFTEHKSNSTS